MAVSGMAVMATARARGHKPSEPSVGHHGGVTQPSVENKTNKFNTQPSKNKQTKKNKGFEDSADGVVHEV